MDKPCRFIDSCLILNLQGCKYIDDYILYKNIILKK